MQWNASEKGYEAREWLANLSQNLCKGQASLLTSGAAGSTLNQDCMFMTHVGHIGRTMSELPKELSWGTMEIPAGQAGKANTGTFWPMVITSKAGEDAKKLDVAIESVQYCGTREAQATFASFTGELPGLIEVGNEPVFTGNPLLKPFIAQLPDANSHSWVDEKEQRDIFIDAWSKITEGEEPGGVLDWMEEEMQAVRDAYFAGK